MIPPSARRELFSVHDTTDLLSTIHQEKYGHHAPSQSTRTLRCGGTANEHIPLRRHQPSSPDHLSAPWGQPSAHRCVQHPMQIVHRTCTYTLQRPRPVALGLLDTVPVSLLVLVVVGMANSTTSRQHAK